MEQPMSTVLTQFFTVLANETRLKMIGLLEHKRYSVRELSDELNLAEPAIAHHLAKLREMGLVNLRAVENSRQYWLNHDILNTIKGYVANLEKLNFEIEQSGDAWIDALSMDEAERDILRHFTHNGRLTEIPTKPKKLAVIVRWLITHFDSNRTYTEAEVNTIIEQYHYDYVQLRRDLIDAQLLQREKDGRTYWRV